MKKIIGASLVLLLVIAGIAYTLIQQSSPVLDTPETVNDSASNIEVEADNQLDNVFPQTGDEVLDTNDTDNSNDPATSGLAPVSDEAETQADETSQTNEEPFVYTHSGRLDSVIDSMPTATGTAQFGYQDGKYNMEAVFSNLTPAHEGWLVDQSESEFFTTGEIDQETGTEGSNVWSSDEDVSRYDFYVLTLEPRDNDPAPADHIVEGLMTLK